MSNCGGPTYNIVSSLELLGMFLSQVQLVHSDMLRQDYNTLCRLDYMAIDHARACTCDEDVSVEVVKAEKVHVH